MRYRPQGESKSATICLVGRLAPPAMLRGARHIYRCVGASTMVLLNDAVPRYAGLRSSSSPPLHLLN